ncbi:MAG: polysaccharide deacetylase family protein [bacterium]|nr:polysaccharide deacetylase family protein [bacterium]
MFQERFTRRQGFEKAAGVVGAAGLTQEFAPVRIKILTYHALYSPDQIYNDVMPFLRDDPNRTPKEAYMPIDLDLAVDLISHKYPPTDQNYLAATCDDGLSSQPDFARASADRIEKETRFPLPIEFFVLTKFEDLEIPVEEMPDGTLSYFDGNPKKHATLGALRGIAREGIHHIRNHTINHGSLPGMSIDKRNAEVEDGEKKILAIYRSVKRVPPKRKVFAYPNGACKGQEEYILSKYDMAVSTERGELHYPWDMGHIGRNGNS